MSQLVATSEVDAVLGGLRRQQVMDIVRGATFIGTLLVAWISLRPFPDLGEMLVGDVSSGKDTATYALFGGLAVLALVLTMRDNMPGLASLLTPPFVLFGAWLCLTIVLSFDPGTSIRRFSLTTFVVVVTAAMMLMPKSQNELMRWFSIAALVLLATCYLGILLAPNLSIHLATDAQEPALAGNWRGAFGHKNDAAAIMAMLLFLGIYICRSGAWISGAIIIGLASLFLFFSAGKSSLTLCFAVLLLTSLTAVVRSLWGRAVMLLTPLILLNLLSVGTVMSDSLARVAKLLPLDTTFTGRTDIWTFAMQSLRERLTSGYGFRRLLGQRRRSRICRKARSGRRYASHSHNGYLDTALGDGPARTGAIDRRAS